MIIGTIKETMSFENRVAISPASTKKLIDLGFKVIIEKNAGIHSGFSDNQYISSGAIIKNNFQEVLKTTNILLQVNIPEPKQLKHLKPQSVIIGNLKKLKDKKTISFLQSLKTTCFALEKLPRISKSQSFDILSSQDNLIGYQSVITASNLCKKIFPLMITSAGTIPPLKVLIIGVGVAGLQAIATAKRLGAKVFAFDIREEAVNQIKSLNAIFVNNLNSIIQDVDIIITSAFQQNKAAPKTIDDNLLKHLKNGSIIIDLAAEYGGNTNHTQNFKLVKLPNCSIYGNSNLSTLIPNTASTLYANNLANFVEYIYSAEQKNIILDFNDIIISETCIMKG